MKLKLNNRSNIKTLWDLGFGTVTSASLIRWSSPILGSPGLMKNVLLANSPQIILSLLCKHIDPPDAEDR